MQKSSMFKVGQKWYGTYTHNGCIVRCKYVVEKVRNDCIIVRDSINLYKWSFWLKENGRFGWCEYEILSRYNSLEGKKFTKGRQKSFRIRGIK